LPKVGGRRAGRQPGIYVTLPDSQSFSGNAIKPPISDTSARLVKSPVFRHTDLRTELPTVLWESAVIG
jgi:hypothetical protein